MKTVRSNFPRYDYAVSAQIKRTCPCCISKRPRNPDWWLYAAVLCVFVCALVAEALLSQ